MKHFLTSLCTLLFLNNFQAQENDLRKIKLAPPITNSDSIIREGIKLHDDKKYDEAIAEYDKINENDSSYVLAQYESILSYIALKKDSTAIVLCDNIIRLNNSYYSKALLLKANAYDNLKQYAKSEEIYKYGIKTFPLSPKFYHELAVSYYNQKKYKEARDNYINAIKINPQYSPSHFQLGLLALKQKKIIPAMLSFQFYLILDNSSKRAGSVIDFLEQIGDDAVKYDDFEPITPIDDNDDFADLEAIVKSKAAYSDKFKSKVKLNFRILKQLQVVLDKLEYNAGDTGFYNQFYAKLFKEMASKNYTETYLYFILSEMNVADADKWVKSNKAKMESLVFWFTNYIRTNYSEVLSEENLPSKKAYKIYSYNEIGALGNYNEKNEKTGYWKFLFTSTSKLKSEGAYNEKGERTGPWKYYYDNGNLKESCTFKNDNIDGEYFKYYSHGKIMNHLFYKDGKLDGLQTLYYTNGAIKNTYEYKNDILDGEEIGYYRTGKIRYKATVKEGLYTGNYTAYFDNGSVKKTLIFNKGLKVGPAKEYYNYPKDAIYAEGLYENDFATGEWKYYYDNGKLSQVGVLNKKGMRDGVWKDYNKEGVMTKEDEYRDGKSEGLAKNFYSNGKIYEEFYYRKNKVNQYKYYNSTGTLVKEISKQKNEFNFELFNKNGTVRMIGKLVGENIEGELITNNYLGLKNEVVEYKNEQKVNKELNFYSNGQISSETPYKNNMQDGLYTKYFVNGKILTQGYYVNDNAEGYWFYYDQNGPLSEIRYYANGEQYGWQRTFACNGKLFRAELLNDGRIVERCYYDTLGNIIKRINYDSCNNCPITIPNVDGNVWIKRNLKNNYINGVSTTLFPDGTTNFLATYDMDMENGVSKSYDVFGKLVRESNYDYDKRQGKYVVYKDSKVQYTANYNNGELNGEAIDYYENEKPFQKTTYEYGDVNGTITKYDEAGNLAIVLNYEDDKLISYSYEDETGKLIPAIEINNPNMVIKAFYKNKKPSINYTLKNGQKEGAYIFYSALGSKITEESYSNGYLNGPRTNYYPNGKIKNKTNFNYGDFNGLYSEYYDTGIIKTEYNYLNDNRHGLTKYYDATGKLTLKCFYYDDYVLKIIK